MRKIPGLHAIDRTGRSDGEAAAEMIAALGE
jgi:hypothetical protein